VAMAGTAMETATAIEMVMVTAMTPTLTPSTSPQMLSKWCKRSPIINQEGVPL
jgi:hypothetical protein